MICTTKDLNDIIPKYTKTYDNSLFDIHDLRECKLKEVKEVEEEKEEEEEEGTKLGF